MIKVCHFTTLHSAFDQRVFQKQCVSLVNAGFDVQLFVINQKNQIAKGVDIRSIQVKYNNRLQRFLRVPVAMYRTLKRVEADIYQFHDPELLPVAYLLARSGRKVIYDAHEDYPLQLLSKPYLPKPIRRAASYFYKSIENFITRRLASVLVPTPPILERYKKINPHAEMIANFPRFEDAPVAPWNDKKQEICYVGSLTQVRGILETVQAIEPLEIEMSLAGTWHFKEFEEKVKSQSAWSKVKELGYIGREEANAVYARSKVGISVLHPIPNYLIAYSVKIFEYMAAGIPVVVSNFPLWKEIVEENKCGICIDPYSIEDQTEAIRYLLENEEVAQEMGRRGREAALRLYNWKTQEDKLVALYKRIYSSN